MESKIYEALAAFQAQAPDVYLDGEVDTGKYKFKYATFPNILKTVRPALAEVGLGFSQVVDGDRLITRLFHKDGGDTIESSMPIKLDGDPKLAGGALTYFKRYALTGLLGVAAEEDRDAPEASGSSRPKMTDKMLAQAISKIGQGGKNTFDQCLSALVMDASQCRDLVRAEWEQEPPE